MRKERPVCGIKRKAAIVVVTVCVALAGSRALAESAADIIAKSESALLRLEGYAAGADTLLRGAAGVLVFPDVVKIGFGAGGQYGKGVLLVGGNSDAFYTTAGSSFGLPHGAQLKSEIIVFRTEKALQEFRDRRSWKIGANANVVVLKLSAGERLNIRSIKAPIVGFVLSDNGLRYNIPFKGSKITRIAR